VSKYSHTFESGGWAPPGIAKTEQPTSIRTAAFPKGSTGRSPATSVSLVGSDEAQSSEVGTQTAILQRRTEAV